MTIQSTAKSNASGVLTMLPRLVASVVFMGALLFVPAGTLRWPMGWAFIGLHVALFAVNMTVLSRVNPDLLEERTRIATEDTKGWDKVVVWILSVFLLGAWVLAGLDARLGWRPEIGLALSLGALLAVAAGYALFSWAMAVNHFFTRDVRIQDKAGHAVCTDGPYRLVRHPGYAGFTLAMLATPLALGSLWALIPAVVACLLLALRTALEDRTLHAELPGYADYAQRTRFRLLPGVW